MGSVLTRPLASPLFMRPVPTLSSRLLMLPMLLPQLMLPDMLDMLVSQLLQDMLVSQLLLTKPSLPNVLEPKSDLSGLCNRCAVSDFLRHTSCLNTWKWGSIGGCCSLFSQVRELQAMSRYRLQFVVITYKTSGFSSLNAFYFKFVLDLVGSYLLNISVQLLKK